MKPLIHWVWVPILLTACASGGAYPHADSARSLFRKIVACGRGESEATIEKNCGRKYDDVAFMVRVQSVKMLGVTYLTLFGEMGEPDQLVNCSIYNDHHRGSIEKLQEGDLVELKGTAVDVSKTGDVTFIHFEKCEVLGTTPIQH